MAQVHIIAFERVHYRQTVEVPDDQVTHLEGMTSEDIIEKFINRSDVFDADAAEVLETRVITTK